ncbi:MAG: ArsR family transcriptional regulator [Desulfobacteraceae bacterium]|nr:ArsR family transcriptional regulator [Desulfobacteraceae bacterium]
MTENKNTSNPGRILQFACDCVSRLNDTVRDPWSHVTRSGFISSETKEIILNRTYCQPKTVTQLAREIGLSQPAIHKHVKELVNSDMLRSVSIPNEKKTYRVEQYYEPNFPVLFLEDLAQMESVCKKAASAVAKIYWKNRQELESSFSATSLESKGYKFDDILDFLYSKIRRMAREVLDEQGYFAELPTHKDGSRWVYWAEEIENIQTNND